MIENIVYKLNQKMRETNMTQKELAEKINMNPVVLHRILSGNTENKSLMNLQKVIEGLGFDWKIVEKNGLPRVEKVVVYYEGTSETKIYKLIKDDFKM